ncbi:hypothetical protein EfmAA96_06250 [Enterococcus faecium]|nr:hypothetical protein EfmAA96_06250 [Enterococcus faecium]
MCSVFTNTDVYARIVPLLKECIEDEENVYLLVCHNALIRVINAYFHPMPNEGVLEDLLSVFFAFFLIKRKNSYFFQSDTFTMELEINIDPSLNEE